MRVDKVKYTRPTLKEKNAQLLKFVDDKQKKKDRLNDWAKEYRELSGEAHPGVPFDEWVRQRKIKIAQSKN